MGVMHVCVLDAELDGTLSKLCQDITGSLHPGMTSSDGQKCQSQSKRCGVVEESITFECVSLSK